MAKKPAKPKTLEEQIEQLAERLKKKRAAVSKRRDEFLLLAAKVLLRTHPESLIRAHSSASDEERQRLDALGFETIVSEATKAKTSGGAAPAPTTPAPQARTVAPSSSPAAPAPGSSQSQNPGITGR